MTEENGSESRRAEIDQIIRSGQQTAVSTGSVVPVAAWTLVSLVLLWLSFTPVDFAAAAWVSLVPLCLLMRVERLPRFSYRVVTVLGFGWALVTLQWMRLGHITMYGALIALAFYVSLYFPVFLALGRGMVKARWPMWLAVPVAWTALEYLRAHLMTGFSWYYLGHTQYQWTSLIQISDITGAYGVSFLVALGAGALAECIPAAAVVRMRLAGNENDVKTMPFAGQRTAVVTAVLCVLGACGYGLVRTIPTDAPAEGPAVAVVQGNFTPELKNDPQKWTQMWMDHHLLSRTAAGLRPDLIVWPESMFPEPDVVIEEDVEDSDLVTALTMPGSMSNSDAAQRVISRWRDQKARQLLNNLSAETGSAMMIGLMTEVHQKDRHIRYNSAAFIQPQSGYVGRYDKMHRVAFGEYIPLNDVFPWLAKFTPFSAGYGIEAGEKPQVFEYDGATFAPVICFEDTVPHLVRDVANTKDAAGNTPDVLINITNDAWFRGSSELDQHLITSVFRCIETRRPMVRAVNAGISAFIDSSGRIRQPEHFLLMEEDSAGVIADFSRVESLTDPATGQRYRQCSAVMCGQVPLDGRGTVYLKFGDWFAMLCSGLILLTLAGSRLRKRAPEGEAEPGPVAAAKAA